MGRFLKLLALLLFIAYPVILHICILKPEVELWQLAFVFAPLLAVASWVAFRFVGRAWPILLIAIITAAWWLISNHQGRIGLQAVNGLSHATLNLFLFWLFGHTLLPGREPLIAQISRKVNGQLYPEVVNYTRYVTIAWCLYAAAQVLISLLLYLFASLEAWSFFVNILNLPLLISMFVVEKAYRTIRFPDHPKTSIWKAIEIYSKDFAKPQKSPSESQHHG